MQERDGNRDARWWLEEYKDERAKAVNRVASAIWQAQEPRRKEWLKNARLYGNINISGLGPRSITRKSSTAGSRLAFNAVRAVCDAYTAKITKDRPKVMFLTSGGDHEIQTKAEQLDMACEGMFYEAGLYEKDLLLVAHSAVFGTAWVKCCTKGTGKRKRPNVDHKFPWEVLVDDEEAAYGDPRSWYERRYVDRSVAMARYPEYADKLKYAKRPSEMDDAYADDSQADQILFVEAWHLPSEVTDDESKTDGRWCLVCDDITLFDEPYNRERPPFESLVPMRPIGGGVHGTGYASQLEGIQFELNTLVEFVQLSTRLLGSGHWLIHKSAQVNANKMDNFPGSRIEWAGGIEPKLVLGQAVAPEVYQQIDRYWAKAFEVPGISQLSASGMKPAGLDSGEAQRVYLDTQTERFKVSFAEYQDFHLRVARQLVAIAGELCKENPEFAVKALGENKMSRIVLSENWLDENDYVLQLFPTNALSNDPAARIAEVSKFSDAGWIDPKKAMRLLGYPDLKAARNLEDASYDLVQGIGDDIMNGRPYIGPEPFMNLEEATTIMQLRRLEGLRKNVPMDRLDLLATWIQQAQDILKPPQDNAQVPPSTDGTMPVGAPPPMDPNAPPMPPGMPPGAPPMPPPNMGGPPQGMPTQ